MRADTVAAMRRLTTALSMTALLLVTASCAPDDSPTPAFDAVVLELFGTTDIEQHLAQAAADERVLVVECMEAAGFSYHVAAPQVAAETDEPATLEEARDRGFGLVAGFIESVESTDLGNDPEAANYAYLSTLTAAEIDRFLITLNGEAAEPGQVQTNSGCAGTARAEAYAEWDRFFAALPNYTALGEERDTHPDWVAAREEWRRCMADRGFDYLEPDAIRSDVTVRMRAAVNERYPQGQFPLIEREGTLSFDPAVRELLEEMQAFEIDAAVADFECTAPLAQRFDAVEAEVQQAFVERNQATIDLLLDGSASGADDG